MRGKSQLVTCYYCGRKVPIDKASRVTKYSFSYFDEKSGIKHRGYGETVYVCPKCARHRGVKNERPMKGRPKKR